MLKVKAAELTAPTCVVKTESEVTLAVRLCERNLAVGGDHALPCRSQIRTGTDRQYLHLSQPKVDRLVVE